MTEKEATPVWTVMQVINWTSTHFTKNGIDAARLTAELLLCEVLGIERIKLYVDFERLLTTSELREYRMLIERRVVQREPLQYILGRTDFYGCELELNRDVLIPRPETELLVETAIAMINQRGYRRIVDVGTGSGCIAIAIAKNCPHVNIAAIDASQPALVLAQKNAGRNNVENVEFNQRDVFKAWTEEDPFDLFVANPPYISLHEYVKLEPELLRHEPRMSLTDDDDGLTFYRRFAELFPGILRKGGAFLCEIGYDSARAVALIFRNFNLKMYKDHAGIVRVIEGSTS